MATSRSIKDYAGALVLKINPSFAKGSLQPAADSARSGRSAGKAQTADVASGRSGTPVALSSTARHLSQLSHSDGDINLVRVNEIRNALEQGTLKINPERIADGLISSAQELVTKSK